MIGYVFEGPIREAIHQLKYRRQRRVARPLAGLLVEPLRAFPSESCVMMPIPMHAARLAERGFNQADILGIEVARTTAMPYTNNALVRVRATEQQAHLNARERRANMQGAFVWQAKGTPPKRVLLIDDVLTTGATMSACALALKQAGVGEVYGVALARSKPDLS
jgi:ComF family protein